MASRRHFKGERRTSACPSCLDGAHGDCLLWNDPGCPCNCIKRCHEKHPGEGLQWMSCHLPTGHQSHHQHVTEWVNEALPGWEGTYARIEAQRIKP